MLFVGPELITELLRTYFMYLRMQECVNDKCKLLKKALILVFVYQYVSFYIGTLQIFKIPLNYAFF